MTLSAWFVAFLLDHWLGDPPRWPHPVRWMGNLITLLQRAIRTLCHSEWALKWGGGGAVVTGGGYHLARQLGVFMADDRD
ncbi:cobD/Cbib family protein [Yersinia enterocolitica]|nr:cobD/Cbib family protein [Yersinia enterocolitica]